jgi:uncharacterized membrane protein YgdD (TMEM256/DUF423 family)
MDRTFLLLAAIQGLLAVGFGAFGAHGLQGHLAGAADGAQRMEWWATAAHYHLTHALALGLAAWAADRFPGTAATVAGWSFLLGMIVFSGSLYVMTLTGIRWLGAITPIGGLALMVGWAAMAVAAWR